MNSFNDIQLNNNLSLKQGNPEQKVQNDSTSSSLNDDNMKNNIENNNNYKLNINQNLNNINQNNMELQNINEDIFPKERLDLHINNKLNSNNSINNIFVENKKIIINEDIPEMILYKYNYDLNLYKESLNDIDYETEWLYDFMKIEKTIKREKEIKNQIKNCLKTILIEYKVKKCDIPFIIANKQNLYENYFTQSQIVDILSVHDAEFLRLQKKRKRIINIYNYIIKDVESNLCKNISNYFKKEYILEAKNESELDLIEAQLGILTFVYQSVEIDENYKKLINYDLLSNLNIDFTLLNKIKDDKLNDILKKFALSPEQVVHNLKIIKGELNSDLIQPPFDNCSLGDLCKEKISEMSGKYTSALELSKISLEYYILLLSSNPYIFKLINEKLFKMSTLSTSPTEKGKDILTSLHPSYHCKRINNILISSFFEEKNENIYNIYTNELGDLYLDIEKCVNNGLIRCDINTGINQIETSGEIKEIIELLDKAINGTNNNNNEEKNKKNKKARNLAIRNMILSKHFSRGFFLNYIKNELHNYSEKYIIKKISSEFFSLISRNYFDQNLDEYSYIISILYNNQKKYFKCLCLDSNYNIKLIMKLEYLWKNEKLSEASITATLNLSKEVSQFNKLITATKPKAIIIDVSNLECYKMINYIRNRFRDSNLIYSDYISKIQKLKEIEITEDQENKQAIDQVKYIISPVNQIIDLWNYKYKDNLLLNLSFHPQQENIKDTSFFSYALESQIIRVVNSKGILLSKLSKYSYNIFNFICGLGPCSSSIIINNLNNPFIIKDSLKQTNPNIYQNISPFIKESMILKNNYIYNLKNNDNKFSLVKLEVFYSMIKDSIFFKKYCLCNAIVSDIDTKNQVINCILLRDCNSIRAILKFSNIDENIQNYQKFFYPQRIILCKIIDIKLRHHSYEILLSNKNDDLISVKDFFLENEKNSKILDKFSINEEEDFTIKEIKKLKEIQKYDLEKEPKSKLLKYSIINMENEQFLMNSSYNNIKKFFGCYKSVEYRIRPSFLGENHLTLTFRLIEDIFLNYDIEISKIELDNYNSNNEKTYMIQYKIEDIYYKSLNELVDIFATKMAKKIKDFKKNEYFRGPGEIINLLFQIFNIKNNQMNVKEINDNKMDIEKNNDIVKYNDMMNDIVLGFMRESPEYGILFTKTNNEYNYCIDFIKILFNGYLFHGKIFNTLYDLINFYKDVHRTNHYQNFIKRQFICNFHSQIEEIDEQYTGFDGPDPNLKKFTDNYIQTNEMKDLKEDLLFPNSNSNINFDSFNNTDFLGKKRKSDNNIDNGWDNENQNIDINIFEMNDINDNDNWADIYNKKNNQFNNNGFNNNNSFIENKKNININSNNNNIYNKGKKKSDGNKNSRNKNQNNNNQNNNWNDSDNNNYPWNKSNNNKNNNDSWNNSNNNKDPWNTSNENKSNIDSWNNTNNNKNDSWSNSNNNNKNKVWGKTSNNNLNVFTGKNNTIAPWGKSNNNNDEWNNPNQINNYDNLKEEKNNSLNNNIKIEPDVWEDSNVGSSWDNTNNINIDNIINDNDNNDGWADSNNNNSTNFSNNNSRDNNKSSYNKENKNDKRNNKNKNRESNFSCQNDKSYNKSNNNFNKKNKNNNNNNLDSTFDWPITDTENNNDDWTNSKNDKPDVNYKNTNINRNENDYNWSISNKNKNNDNWGNSDNNNKNNFNVDNWGEENYNFNNSNKGKDNNNPNNYFQNKNKNNYNRNNDFKKNNSNFNNKKNYWGKNDNNNNNKNKSFNNNNNNNNKNYGNNNKSWNKNSNNKNNQQSIFSGWPNDSDNDNNQFNSNSNKNINNNSNNNKDYDDWFNNNKKDFHKDNWANSGNKKTNYNKNYNKNYNNYKKKVSSWREELTNKYDGSKDIKQEKDEGVINFNNKDLFGGYNI